MNLPWKRVLSLLFWFAGALGLCSAVAAAPSLGELQAGFAHPPESARPWIYWFWLDGNVSRAGITADLEAMQRVGIGGVLLMDIDQEIPTGPVRFASPEWRQLFQHAVSEAGRLGLVLNIQNSAGWTGSGGPWVTPDLGMQKLVCMKTNLVGPSRFQASLPPLPDSAASHDVAVLAFPSLVGEGGRFPGPPPKLTTSADAGMGGPTALSASANTDFKSGADEAQNAPARFTSVPSPRPGKPEYIQVEFKESFKASLITLVGVPGYGQAFAGHLDSSENGRSFRQIREFRSSGNGLALTFDTSPARFYRIVFTLAEPWLKALRFSQVEISPIYRLESSQAKSGLGLWPPSAGVPASTFPAVPACGRIRLEDLRDLTALINKEGQLDWNVPTGKWTVLRFGWAPTGQSNHPALAGGAGLECDKLSKEAIEAHFESFLSPLLREAGSATGTAFISTHVDSWEVGFQNWTPLFREEFRRRRGYDPVPYLPAVTGRVVGSVEQSERFLWDMRRTIADLLADNYAGHLAQLAHQNRLQLSMEAYDKGPFDDLQCAGRVDVPMAEFWLEDKEHRDLSQFYLRPMPSAAHTYGKPVVAAEAFTCYGSEGKWQNHPFLLKPLADVAFCEGINRLVFHRYAHQPWLNLRPGMTMGQMGIEYERTETWWEFSKPWHQYLARCQFLLQQGQFAADLCYLTQEGAYTKWPKPIPAPPAGFDYDLVTPELAAAAMTCENGQLVLLSGMRYRLLVLPPSQFMTPKLLRRLKALVEAGATITGPPPSKSPSLTDFPGCDAEVQDLARQLWGSCDGKTNREHPLGKGRLIWGRSLGDILASLQLEPDFQQLTGSAECPLRYIHRHLGPAEAYFICSPKVSTNSGISPADPGSASQSVTVQCRFRIQGKQPELWHADTALIEKPACWAAEGAHTDLPLKFTPGSSLFVVFRDSPGPLDPVVSITRDGHTSDPASLTFGPEGKVQLLADSPGDYRLQTASGKTMNSSLRRLQAPIEIGGPWQLRFPPGNGAPEQVTLPRLSSWTENPEPGMRFFSGTATYTKTVSIGPELVGKGQRLILDLGRVEVMAKVKLNDKDLGILWKPAFALDITDAVEVGSNHLEVEVVNLWPNRLIGDEQLPEDCTWQTPTQAGAPLAHWASWLLEGKPRPSGRITFATWKHWTKDSKLLESGLLGPVTLRSMAVINFTE